MANYDLAFPGAAIDAILTTAYDLQNAGYIFKGSATAYSGTPTQRTWLLAPAGFSGYGFSSAIPKGSIGICKYNGSAWSGDLINVVTIDNYPTHDSTNAVTSGGMWQALDDLADGIWDTLQSFVIQDGTTSANQGTKIKFDVKMTDGQQVQHLISSFGILAATTAKAGLMSAADKVKVDAFLDNLRSLSFTDTTPGADAGTKIVETLKMTVGGVQEAVTALTILAATTSKAGLMSAADKTYLDGIPSSLSTINTSISKLLAMLGYYECSTAAGTAAKIVSASGYVLTTGGCIRIKMTNANTADNVTLNINSTGAKTLYYDGAQASSSNSWDAGDILEVYYDGTQYQCASGGGGKFATGEKVKETSITDEITPNSDSLPTSGAVAEETDNLKANIGYFTCDTAAGTAAKVVAATGYKLTTGGNIRIKMTHTNSAANVTLNINGTGAKALFYNGQQASSSNKWEDMEVLLVYYDGTRYQAINANGGKIDTLEYDLIPVTWVDGYYVNSSNTLVQSSGYRAAQNVDITGYSKIIANVISASGDKIVILDENSTVLASLNGTKPTINLASYPTAKYISFSNKYTYSGEIWGMKAVNEQLNEQVAGYIAMGDRKENYVRNLVGELWINPTIKKGFYINGSNTLTSFGAGQYSDYFILPPNALKLYYSGRAYGSAIAVTFYDKYKNVVSTWTNSANADVHDQEVAIPAAAYYVRLSSMNSLLEFDFDVKPPITLSSSDRATVMQNVPLSWQDNSYINASNVVVSQNGCHSIQNFDISLYAGKRIIVFANPYFSAARNLLMDANYNILFTSNSTLDIDLTDYPTAKYLSLTNNGGNYSGEMYVFNNSDETIQEIVSSLYKGFGNNADYVNEIATSFYKEPEADVTGAYLNTSNSPVTFTAGKYSSKYYLLPPTATKVYYTGVSYGSAAGVLFFNKDKTLISAVAVNTNNQPVSNKEVAIPANSVYFRISSMSAACGLTFDSPTAKVGGGGGGSDNLANYLYGKKYVAIGDSFTAPIGDEVIQTGPLAGMSKVYAYIIANRNNMNVLNQAVSGSVLNWYLANANYNNIPADVDYITIWYGINDGQHGISVGTVDDQPTSVTSETSTTTCGGFNFFFKWLLTNRPFAHVGVIISDYISQDRHDAIIACCKKWGFPYLDLMGDPTIPMLSGGRTSDISVSADAIALRSAAFNINGTTNVHPNNSCHEWQSTFIEAFMRRI